MGIKKYNPTSPGKRFRTVMDYAEVTTSEPRKALVRPLRKTGGRNNSG
jgi:large subunit ribosomal protein L2